MLGDASRGFLLEHVLTKLLYIHHHRVAANASGAAVAPAAKWKEEKKMHDVVAEPLAKPTLPALQIIGLSATLPNIQTLCDCLHATFFRQAPWDTCAARAMFCWPWRRPRVHIDCACSA